jgi:hypothetical protein
VFATVDGDTVRVAVSLEFEADVLSILDQPPGLAVAEAVRGGCADHNKCQWSVTPRGQAGKPTADLGF